MRYIGYFHVWLALLLGLYSGRVFSITIKWTPTPPPGEERITGAKWTGFSGVADGYLITTYTAPSGPFPNLYTVLPGQYEITSIQMVLQHRDPNVKIGFNQSFDILTYEGFFNPCKSVLPTGWKVCKKGVVFTTPGETITVKCEADAARAQYVMATRRAIFDGVTALEYDPSWVELKANDSLGDVVLCWDHGQVISLAVTRGQGRIFVMQGEQWADLSETPSRQRLKENLQKWFGNGAKPDIIDEANLNELPAGKIILLKRKTVFDLEKVKQAVLSGTNGLIIAYTGTTRKDKGNTLKLFYELGIGIQKTGKRYFISTVDPSSGITSDRYIPASVDMDRRIKSWSYFCSKGPSVDYTALKTQHMADLIAPGFQEKLREMLDKYAKYFEDRAPCEHFPFKWDSRNQKCWINYNLWAMAQMTENPIALFGTEEFPGRVSDDAKPVTHRVKASPPIAGAFNPLGVYVAPGKVFSWKVIEHSSDIGDYGFTFGCHADNLNNIPLWQRWPRFMHTLEMRLEGRYASPVGGVLFLFTKKNAISITLELSGVYHYPLIDLHDKKSVENWDKERQLYAGVPWMATIGDVMHTCLPTKEVVKLTKDDIVWSLTYLDNAVKMVHNFRGSDWNTSEVQVFATDVQLEGGEAHAGTPIMAKLYWHLEVTDVKNIRANSATGITHELGHNMQNHPATFKDGIEVTNNVNNFPIRVHLINKTSYEYGTKWGFYPGEMDRTIQVWNGNKYVGVNLGYYNWLGILFGEGLLTNLWHDAWANRGMLKTEESKVNFWLSKMCQETQHNIIPWQELWKFPIKETTRIICSNYPCFFPDDQVTQKAP
ncbi:unnamed protein product, partial [Echinostoma caproni]|uniref:Peptidase M60 domain-containing protein n=1 Tax=Echinostoma caproni TaxID=27848 RepID=A0A183AHM3_9TREM